MTERDIFIAALQREDLAERRAYLDKACAGRPDLRRQVEELLRLYEGAGSFLESPPAEPPATGPFPDAAEATSSPEVPGSRIGPYKLLQLLGEGGMGAVYVAEQEEPVKRRVALKIIKAGMDSARIIARFEAERQALAMMDHPNIAKVLDAGTIDGEPGRVSAGRPYFVMELVKGIPITKFCDQEHLTPKERLDLFIPVCHAVQHAHQKGIIHRDIKPSNVLIALYDGKPVPKVIDFGVAKATAQKLTERTMYTEVGQIVGTLEYMAPEQAELNNLDIDTRADIYSLGVLLYELLTGSPPFTAKQLRSVAFTEMLRIIRESEPPKPSTKLSSSEELPSIAAKRKLEPAKLAKLVRGELDWIVMKALEKERSRRYETANALAMDVQRYLADEPVLAGPPTAGYRLRKFVRKHRGPVLAASLVLLALVAGIAGTTWGLFEAKRQESLAKLAAEEEQEAKIRERNRANGELQAKLEAEAKRQEAERNLAFAKKGNAILGSVFAGIEPRKIAESGRPVQDVLRENLKQAVKDLDGSAIGAPLVVAEMQHTLGQSLLGLGEAGLAIEVLEKALDTRKTQLGPDHVDALACMSKLASAYRADGKLEKALGLDKETLAVTKAKLGPDHVDTLICMNNLAAGLRAAGKQNEALALLKETFELTKAALGADHPNTLTTMHNLAVAYRDAGKRDEGLALLKESFELTKARRGVDHPDTLISMSTLASAYQDAGEMDKSLPLQEEALRRLTVTLGPDHPSTLTAMNNLAECYRDAGKLDRALPLYEETLKLTKAKLGPDHPGTLATMSNLADGYRAAGRLDKALPLYEETLKLMKAKLGPDHPDSLGTMNNLALAYRQAGKLDLALPLQEETLKQMKAKLGPEHPDTLDCMSNLGKAYCEARRGEKASATLAEFIAGMRKRNGNDGSRIAGLLAKVSLDLLNCGQDVAAEPMLRELLGIREKKEPNMWTTFDTQSLLGAALLGQKKYADAEPLLVSGYTGMRARIDTIPPELRTIRLIQALERLVLLCEATGKKDEALRWRKEINAVKAGISK